jgi:protein tyrosine phosphatase (PTP) superfamily phosphohydrolase (DUF442 family)
MRKSCNFDQFSGRITVMENYHQLTPMLHTAGYPTQQDLLALRAAGVTAVINLAVNSAPDGLPDEAARVAEMGMDYIHIPVVWANPTRHNLADFFDAMDSCRERATLVHCAKNMRVSVFIYLYRILQLGWTEESARPDLQKIWEPTGTWADFISKMLPESDAR